MLLLVSAVSAEAWAVPQDQSVFFGAVVDSDMNPLSNAVVSLNDSLFAAGSRCSEILIHLDGIRVSELVQGDIDFLTNPRRLGAVEVYTGAAQIRSDTMRPTRRAA